MDGLCRRLAGSGLFAAVAGPDSSLTDDFVPEGGPTAFLGGVGAGPGAGGVALIMARATSARVLMQRTIVAEAAM